MKKIRVGIDVSRVRRGMTGAGKYAAGVLSALDAAMPEAEFILYAYRDTTIELASPRWRVVSDKHPLWSRLPVTQWMHWRLGSLIKRDSVDVFWSPNTFIPMGVRVPCVLSVLDFNHVLVPQTLPPVTRFAHRRWINADIMAAEANVAISHGTSDRMFELLGRRPDAIAFPAVSTRSKACDQALSEHLLRSSGVRSPYLLAVGSRAPRKNLASAVAAMEQLRAGGLFLDYQFVMAGPEAWNRSGRTVEYGRDWVKPLGFVSEELLSALYERAEALVFPSLYEGFGMPVLEARAHGCRVVTTDSPELREAGGLDAIYADTSPEGIAKAISAALSMPRPPPVTVEHKWEDAAVVLASVLRRSSYRSRGGR